VTNGVPQSEILEIKRQIGAVEESVNRLYTAQAVTNERVQHVNERVGLLRDQFRAEVRSAVADQLSTTGKERRDVSAWVIGLVSFGLVVVFSLIQLAIQLWGG
jgi:hypothetical protein